MLEVVDYSHKFPNHLVAQGKGSNFIAIEKLDQPFQRADGKQASFQVDHRWLSSECTHENDENYVRVEGQEFTYWQEKEIKRLLKTVRSGNEVNVFDYFNLF